MHCSRRVRELTRTGAGATLLPGGPRTAVLTPAFLGFNRWAALQLIVQSCPDPDAAPAGKPASGTGAARGQGDTASTHEGAAALAAAVAAAAAGRAAFEARVRRTALAETAQAAG